MSFLDLRERILDPGLCANCGACVASCPGNLLTIDIDHPEPRWADPADETPDAACGSCGVCLEVCPGKHPDVAASETRLFDRTRTAGERWTGISLTSMIGRAKEPDVLDAASAGGATTALLVAALRSGAIDAALVIGRDLERPWIPAPTLATSEQQIIECAQASYCITPNLQLLRDYRYDRVAVVGLPCQIEAVNKMRGLTPVPAAARRVVLTIEIACSSNTLRTGTESLITGRLSLPLTDVRRMRYRAGQYPGEFTVWGEQGERSALPFHQLVTDFTKHKTFRCLTCPDWWSGLADISVADGDPNIFRTSRNGTPTEKASMMLVRTETGMRAVRRAMDTSILDAVEAPFVPETSLGLQRKRHRYERYRRDYPGAVPEAPAGDESIAGVLEDAEVIERMSPQ